MPVYYDDRPKNMPTDVDLKRDIQLYNQQMLKRIQSGQSLGAQIDDGRMMNVMEQGLPTPAEWAQRDANYKAHMINATNEF